MNTITIRDVAKKAGVSVATVSRIINNKGKIKKETEELVLQVIESLSYTPNMVAQGLSKRQSSTVGLIVPTITNPFFPEIARAVEDVAKKNNFNVLLCNTDDRRDEMLDYINTLSSQYVGGILISSHNVIEEDMQTLSDLNIPIVMMDRVLKNKEFSTITVNNREGGRIATKHLLDVGCKRIAHIRGLEKEVNAKERMLGYKDIVSKLPWFDQSWIGVSEYSVRNGYQVAKELFFRHRDIDGIFVSNDLIAIGVLKAVYELGLEAPKDIAIVGFDGIDMSGLTVPGITTIQQPIYQIGELATEELITNIKNKDMLPTEYVLDVNLVIRGSTMIS